MKMYHAAIGVGKKISNVRKVLLCRFSTNTNVLLQNKMIKRMSTIIVLYISHTQTVQILLGSNET